MIFSLTAGLSAAAIVGYAGYASMAPHSQLYGRTITHGSDARQMALTFDDGPNDPHTFHLLELLARYDAKATFFLIGKYARRRPDIVRAIHQGGHDIGNHTYNHPNLIFVSPSVVQRELEDCQKALEDSVGQHAPLFRPPFGGRLPHVFWSCRSLALTPVMWSVTAFDWSAPSSAVIFDNVLKRVSRSSEAKGHIVLLHDGGHLAFGTNRAYTVEATGRLLDKYSREDKKFVSISELAR
jgi:peptidoglycan-N-acetylglucosamine deacetylase